MSCLNGAALYSASSANVVFKLFFYRHCCEATLSLLIGKHVFRGREHLLLFDSKVWHAPSSLVCVKTSVMLKRCPCRCLQTARAVGSTFTVRHRELWVLCSDLNTCLQKSHLLKWNSVYVMYCNSSAKLLLREMIDPRLNFCFKPKHLVQESNLENLMCFTRALHGWEVLIPYHLK